MAVFRTGNPALSEKTFGDLARTGDDVMTLQGTVNKTGISLLIVCAGAIITWNMEQPILLLLAGAIGGAILGFVTVFKKQWAPITTPIYAFLEGLLLGAISRMYDQQVEGIVP